MVLSYSAMINQKKKSTDSLTLWICAGFWRLIKFLFPAEHITVPSEQSLPVHPGLQAHVKLLRPSTHVPLGAHGELKQSSTSAKKGEQDQWMTIRVCKQTTDKLTRQLTLATQCVCGSVLVFWINQVFISTKHITVPWEQSLPVHPGLQEHVKLLTPSTHVPPAAHGELKQSSTSARKEEQDQWMTRRVCKQTTDKLTRQLTLATQCVCGSVLVFWINQVFISTKHITVPWEQSLPVHPGLQEHVKLLTPSTHVPPAAHGELKQSSTSVKKEEQDQRTRRRVTGCPLEQWE